MLDEITHEPRVACFSIDIALCCEVPVRARRTVGCEARPRLSYASSTVWSRHRRSRAANERHGAEWLVQTGGAIPAILPCKVG